MSHLQYVQIFDVPKQHHGKIPFLGQTLITETFLWLFMYGEIIQV